MKDETTIDGCNVEFILRHVTKEKAEAELDYLVEEGIIPASERGEAFEYWMYAWKTTIGNHPYGDSVKLSDPSLIAESRELLTELARQVIDRVKKSE